MKILPINNIALNSQINKNNKQVKNNYSNNITDLNLLNKNYNQISFRAVSKESLEFVLKIPLEDRLASMFEKMENGDIILVGKSLSQTKLKLLECIDNIDTLIKRVFYLPEEKHKGYLGFFKDKDGDRQVINLNDYDIRLHDSEALKTDVLTANDSFYIYDNDLIIMPNNKEALQIKDKPKVDLTGYRKNFCKAVDFSKGVQEEIEKLNRKVVSQLSREVKEKETKVTFKDVGGQDELIKELKRSILFPIKYPEMYENFDVNKGFILYGVPGTGKTHISRALANEANAYFKSLNGLEMESKWVGDTEGNWRELFDEAIQKQPSIIFIDEIDAIGRARGGADEHGDKALDQLLTLISDLDSSNNNVFIIGATNDFKALDKALIRSGRLSKHIEVHLPDLAGLEQIFEIHTANKPLDRNLDKKALTKRLFNLKATGADIKYIVNEAYLAGYDRAGIHEKMNNDTICGKDKKQFNIIQEDFDKAIQMFIETREGSDRRPIGFNK